MNIESNIKVKTAADQALMKAEMKIEDCELVKASLKFHLLITLFLENNIISVNCIKKVDNSVLLS